jgi:hypothetical protein
MNLVPSSQAFDVVAASLDGAVSASFPESRGSAYPQAVAIARGASRYAESDVGGLRMHFVAFSLAPVEVSKAAALMRLLARAKGALAYAGGRVVHSARVADVLECYAIALSCKDHRAHCIVSLPETDQTVGGMLDITPDFLKPQESGARPSALFPCRLLGASIGFRIDPAHPASRADQIEAAAVREGCSWCPRFSPAIS